MGAPRFEDPTRADPTVLLLVTADPGTLTGDGLEHARGYEVRYAFDGQTVGDRLDEAVDVVLFDTRLSRVSCADVLSTIGERDLDCRCIALVGGESAAEDVTVDVDAVLELPVSPKALLAGVDAMLKSRAYDRKLGVFYALAARKAAFETEYEPATLADHPRYRELSDRCATLDGELEELLGGLSWRDAYAAAFDRLHLRLDLEDE